MIERFFILKIIIITIAVCMPSRAFADAKIADLSGVWYTASSEALSEEIEGYLDKVSAVNIDGSIIAVISPHAGFKYSGEVAAYSFRAMQSRPPSTLIIVGFTHQRSFPGTISVFTQDAFVTPLGTAKINSDVTEKLISFHPAIVSLPEAFSGENSVEMLIPFAQKALPDTELVLVAIADQNLSTSGILAEALYSVMSQDDGVMAAASTDMSHYFPRESAERKDSATIEKLKRMSPETFFMESAKVDHTLMCGHGAVFAVMKASKMLGADHFDVLKYATSAETSGEDSRVVGYLSAAFVMRGKRPSGPAFPNEEGKMFSREEKRTLLKIARESIISYLDKGKKPDLQINDQNLNLELGGFVTLRENGVLRGCIGKMTGDGPFYKTVMDMAVAAATEDPRFPRVKMYEMDSIDIEISALSPLRKINDPSEIEMGKHGVLVKMGGRSGVYLPQVAVETGWSRDEFMDSLCAQKAGIPSDAWKTGSAEIYIYTAEIFREKEF